MEDVLKWTNNQHDLKAINNCLLYPQVFQWSDITNATGNMIQIGAYDTNVDITSMSTHLWPLQKVPGPPAWKIWWRFLATRWKKGRYLISPLGAWHPHIANTYMRKWQYTYYPKENRVRDTEGNIMKIQKFCRVWRGKIIDEAISQHIKKIGIPIDKVDNMNFRPVAKIQQTTKDIPQISNTAFQWQWNMLPKWTRPFQHYQIRQDVTQIIKILTSTKKDCLYLV